LNEIESECAHYVLAFSDRSQIFHFFSPWANPIKWIMSKKSKLVPN
jgi:hypothetical protein